MNAASMLWTGRQRTALCILIAAVSIVLLIRYTLNRADIPDPQAEVGARAGELPDRIDPNTADWPALAAIPVLGKSAAVRIVETREAFLAANPGQRAFERPEDLLRVKGIGPATLQAIQPYLSFPGVMPTSNPADP